MTRKSTWSSSIATGSVSRCRGRSTCCCPRGPRTGTHRVPAEEGQEEVHAEYHCDSSEMTGVIFRFHDSDFSISRGPHRAAPPLCGLRREDRQIVKSQNRQMAKLAIGHPRCRRHPAGAAGACAGPTSPHLQNRDDRRRSGRHCARREGLFIADLRAEDFEVLDGGVPQESRPSTGSSARQTHPPRPLPRQHRRFRPPPLSRFSACSCSTSIRRTWRPGRRARKEGGARVPAEELPAG